MKMTNEGRILDEFRQRLNKTIVETKTIPYEFNISSEELAALWNDGSIDIVSFGSLPDDHRDRQVFYYRGILINVK